MTVRAYPAYRDSGVEWAGQIPKHWQVVQLKRLSPVRRGASPRPIDDPKYFDDDGRYSWVRISDVSKADGNLRGTEQKLSELGSSLSVKIHPGDLFISIAGTVGKPCISSIDACIHDGFVYFPALRLGQKFLFRIFEAGLCYAGLGKFGTQLNLNTDTIGSISVPLPPEHEISTILIFLDRETGKIDALVAEQERLIALLKEKRQAVISHAVTKGLNPNAPMKDSGVPWLGEVPAHWIVTRAKVLATLITSGPRGWSERIADDGVLFIQSGDIDDKLSVQTKTAKRIDVILDAEAVRSRLQDGDVVVCITGAKTGNVGLFNGAEIEAYINQHLSLIRPNKQLRPRFLGYVLKGNPGQLHFNTSQYGLKQGLSLEDVGSAPVAVPPILEQDRIVALADQQLGRLSALEADATRAMVLLRERRAALISAAVTGKIDVRDLVPATQQAA